MKLIAIVGMAGSGKSELANLFEENSFTIIRFGEITDEILIKKGLEINEENEKKARENLREKHGMAAYAKLNFEKIEDAFKKNHVVIDGLYSWEEYLFLKEKFRHIITLAVYAPPDARYERLVDRKVRPLIKEQSRKRDVKEIENLNKSGPIAMADYTIFNVGTLFDLKDNLGKFVEWMKTEDRK